MAEDLLPAIILGCYLVSFQILKVLNRKKMKTDFSRVFIFIKEKNYDAA